MQVNGTLQKGSRFAPGTLLAERYRLVSLLGRGGMGEVYRAEDLTLGDTVALKLLREEAVGDAGRLERLLEEARLARKVSHPNVCRVHDVDEAEGLHFISMEHIDGEDLAALLRRIGRLPRTKALEFSGQLCNGLEAVHGAGLLHRDLKPGNIMIDGEGRARLTDFGLAGLAESASQGGTPAYMAPELHSGRLPSVRSDVYALGLVLYELFTGQRPFQAGSPVELAWQHLETAPEPPSRLSPSIDPALDELILACLEKVPERRPVSARKVAEALSRIDARGDSGLVTQLPMGSEPKTLLASDLLGRGAWESTLGEEAAGELDKKHGRLTRDLLALHGGEALQRAGGLLALFERPLHALLFALEYHAYLHKLSRRHDHRLEARVGIHLGEVELQASPSTKASQGDRSREAAGPARSVAMRLMAFAGGRQTLLTREAFDLARRAASGVIDAHRLGWLAHGSYRVDGVPEPLEVFEVGHAGRAPLEAPEESQEVRRLVMQPKVAGWRPAPDLLIPQRPHWRIERRLGEGGFGEVWLARHTETGERRSFKFCFDAERLRTLEREITLFRLLKEELGERDDINRILDWSFEEAPYFIESEYTPAGSLPEWAEGEGGLGEVPLETRLQLVAEVADALAAAHSVGVLHKDVKPSNILIRSTKEGAKAQLADFGIGQVTERERLAAAGITVLGLSEPTEEDTGSTAGGTRLYLAPELLEGHPPTLQADLYALGVLLYQLVVGDFGRALAPGWRRDIDDEILTEDIACLVDRSPERRPASAREVARRLRTLEARREEHLATEEARRALKDSQRRRQIYQAVSTVALIALLIVSGLAIWAVKAGQKEKRARQDTDEILTYMVELFELTDPFGTADPGESRGESITAREILDRGVQRVESEFSDRPIIFVRLLETFGNIYRSLWLPEEAQSLLERALHLRQTQNHEPLDLASTLHSLASLHTDQGEYKKATEYQHEALALRRKHLGEYPDTVSSLSNLAHLLSQSSDFVASKLLYEEALSIARELDGEEQAVIECLYGLAKLAKVTGDNIEREEWLYREALRLGQRKFGTEHPNVADLQQALGSFLWSKGDLPGADALLSESVAKKRRLLGNDHPRVAASLNDLSLVRAAQGDRQEAEDLMRQALSIAQKQSGGNQFIATLLGNLGYIIIGQGGRNDEAIQLLQESLGLRREFFGDEHPLIARSIHSLAETHSRIENHDIAIQLHRDGLELRRRILDDNHPEVGSSLISLARALINRDRFSEAENLALEAIEIFDHAALSESWQAGEANSILAVCYIAEKDFMEAERILLASLPLIHMAGKRSPVIKEHFERLKILYERWNKPDKATQYRRLWEEAGGGP